uniref:Uncharacterized protein n=1 Tax=Trichuris muris TaxID=70415 RepID=A0A5S6R4K5_TRIMR
MEADRMPPVSEETPAEILDDDKRKCFEQGELSLPTVERDSGTESDEELELIETNSMASVAVSQTSDYYASQPSWSISSCHSVVGSPVCCALNDQDLNCWDNLSIHCGSEQQSAAADDDDVNEQPMDPELPVHHYHTRQQFQRLKQQISVGGATCLPQADSTGSSEPTATGIPSRKANFSVSASSKTAFVCLKRSRERSEQEATNRGDEEEQRNKWETNVHAATRRTAPIRLLIPPTDETGKEEAYDGGTSMGGGQQLPRSNESTSADTSPRKKSRHNALKCSTTSTTVNARPSLNFEKMQKKMVKPVRKKGSSCTSRDSMKAKVKLRAWSDGYQLRSCGNNFLFRPLESADDAFNQVEHDIDDLVRKNCRL